MFDALSLAPLPAKGERREFTDPQQPGKTLALTLKPLTFADRCFAQQIGAKLRELYLQPPKGQPRMPWPPPPYPPMRITETLLFSCALMEAAQCPENPEEFQDAARLMIVSEYMPTAWEVGVLPWFNEMAALTAEPETVEGNSSAAPEGNSCAPPATEEESTPPSPITSAPRCGPSTIAYVPSIPPPPPQDAPAWNYLACRPRS